MRNNVEPFVRSLRLPAVVLAAAALVACGRSHNQSGSASRAANEPTALAVDTYTTTDTVKAIDYATRTVTLQGPDGTTGTYRIGPEMTNFNQVHVGDQVKATVTEGLAVGVRKAGTPPNAGEKISVALAPKGARPGMFVEKTAEATAKITGIDRSAGTVTLDGMAGKQRTMKLAPGVDMSNMKKGDDVVVRYTDAIALVVEKP
jgi:hypothetical protein